MGVINHDKKNDTENLTGNESGIRKNFNVENSFGLNPHEFSLMSTTKGSDYTLSVATELSKAFKASGKASVPNIAVLDKETFTKLSYSVIVTHMRIKDRVLFYTILLEATGRKPLTASEIMEQFNAAIKTQNNGVLNIYTADEAYNEPLMKIVKEVLRQEYVDVLDNDFKSIDGAVLRTEHPAIETVAKSLAYYSYNALTVEGALDSGTSDININHIINTPDVRGKQFRLESVMTKAAQIDYLGNPIRSDWGIDLTLNDPRNNKPILNMENNKITVASVKGFVDAIPQVVDLSQGGYGAPVVKGTRLRPNIVITSNKGVIPSTGYALLGLISASVMAYKSMWVAALKPSASDVKSNIGALNILTKLDDGNGARLDLANKKYTPEEVHNTILQMFDTLDPIISMDCESFGPQTSYLSIFSAAANSSIPIEKETATQLLVETANWLTSGHFPSEYHKTRDIFVTDGVVVPTGKWVTKSAERDLREIDLAFLASHTDDEFLLQRWALSNLPATDNGGSDPYLTKVDIISQLIPSAEITGKAIRVTFTSDFIKTLVNAASMAGLSANYEPEIRLETGNDLNIISAYLNQGGISGINGVAREYIHSGPSYNTPYSNMGLGRYR